MGGNYKIFMKYKYLDWKYLSWFYIYWHSEIYKAEELHKERKKNKLWKSVYLEQDLRQNAIFVDKNFFHLQYFVSLLVFKVKLWRVKELRYNDCN